MIGQIIRKEILESLLNRRFMALAIFSMLLMPLSATISSNFYEARRISYDSQFAEYSSQEHPVWDQRAYRPPELMSTLALGADPYMPVYFEYQANIQNFVPGTSESQEFSALSVLGSFDALFLIQIVFSLLAILLAFDLVVGEKEAGTLKAILANRIPRDQVMFGKFFGGYAVLWTVFTLGFLLLYIVLAVQDARFLESDIVQRVIFIYGISSAYLAGFFSLGLMVSSFCYTSKTAITSLLVVWVVLQLIIPKSSQMIASSLITVPSEHEITSERGRVVQESAEQLARDAADLYLRLSGDSDIHLASQRIQENEPWSADFYTGYQTLFRDAQKDQADRIRALQTAWELQKQRQQKLASMIGLLSPATALMFLTTDISGTGDRAIEAYNNRVDQHLQIVDREIFEKSATSMFILQQNAMRRMGRFVNAAQPVADNVPAFYVPRPSLPEVIQTNGLALLTLLSYILLPLVVGHVRFLFYDVR